MTLSDSSGTEVLQVVGVDIGGTKVLAGLVDEAGVVKRRVRVATPHRSTSPGVVEDTIVEAVSTLLADDGEGAPTVIGVAAAGFIDSSGERVVFSPHLSWRDEPLRQALAGRLDAPVLVDNDANAAAWAETRFGAARGARNALMITLGTGIGGALVLNGEVFRGSTGMAGEFGHTQVVPGGRICECGQRGCWEQYVSGNALSRVARERSGEAGPDAMRGPDVTAAAKAGDAHALAVFHELGDWLGVGLANLVAAFDPDLVVVGGGLSEAGDLLLTPARDALAARLVGGAHRTPPPVVRASLGPEAGFIGAADLARKKYEREVGA